MVLRLFIFIVVLFLPGVAKADYFFWQDEKTGMSMTFPDTWKTVNNVNPDTILTVVGPSETGQPICRVDVRPDGRYTIYPARYGAAVQKVAVSRPFWQKYLGQYDKFDLGNVYDGAGRWFASSRWRPTTAYGEVLQSRHDRRLAHNDKLYVSNARQLRMNMNAGS